MVSPHVLEFGEFGGHIGASFPELVHDFGIDLRFLPQLATTDASAANIYDNDGMLLSVFGQRSTEIKQTAVRYIETVLSCFKEAEESSNTASALVSDAALADVI